MTVHGVALLLIYILIGYCIGFMRGRSGGRIMKNIITCLTFFVSGFAVGYYTGGEYMRRIFLRLNRRLTDEEIRIYQERIYGKE